MPALEARTHRGRRRLWHLRLGLTRRPDSLLSRCCASAELAELESKRDALEVPDEEAVSEVHALRTQLARYEEDKRTVINHPSYALPFLQPGRLVRVSARRP